MLPKLPHNFSILLGFDAIVAKYRGMVFITYLDTAETQVVFEEDIDYLEPTAEDIADVIADRIAADLERNIMIDRFLVEPVVYDTCPSCGL